MSCRTSINRDLEFRLAHVALAALNEPPVRRECRTIAECDCWPPCHLLDRNTERCDECGPGLTNHTSEQHRAAEAEQERKEP